MLCVCSRTGGVEKKEALWEAASADRRHIDNDRVSAWSSRECEYKHRSIASDGRCSKGTEECPQEYVRIIECQHEYDVW